MDAAGDSAAKVVDAEANKMGIFSCTSYVIGNIIGSGIFITPTSIVAEVNSVGLSLVVWAACGLISLLGSIVYIELGTSIIEPGCDFAYVCFVKWYYLLRFSNSIEVIAQVAFSFMWVGVIITFPASVAVQAQTFGQYVVEGLAPLFQLDEPYAEITRKALGILLLVGIVWLNFYSLNEFAAKFQIIATVAKLGSMALIIVAGFYLLIFKGQTSNLENGFKNSNYGVGHIVLGLYAGLWSYAGWDILNYGTPEIRKPERTMPYSLIVGITIVTSIYMLINISYFIVLSVDEVKNTTAIAATFSQTVFGGFSYIVPFMVAVLICGTLNSNIFCGSRCMYAAAREGHLPAFLSCIHEGNGSPRAALLAQGIITTVLVFINVNKLIECVSFVMSFQRIATVLALLWIHYKKIPVHPGAIKIPEILTWLFLLISIALVVIPIVTSFVTTMISNAILLGGILFYVGVIKRKAIPSWLQRVNNSVTRLTMRFLHCKVDLKEEQNCMPEPQEDENGRQEGQTGGLAVIS
uniref:Amino acid permease/ SLC12A domain-containing protein n=1 Tax=Ascaris lumbricoides TaxID=6252 RepID=A0A9J2PB04_ASCLU